MSVFISFNFRTGFCAAMTAASQLRDAGEDCWWFPEPLDPEQIDGAVGSALESSHKCLLVWSKAELTPWQYFEIFRIRDHLAKRAPAGDPTDMFLILRNMGDPGIHEQQTLPMFSHCEYIDYNDPKGPHGTKPSSSCPEEWIPEAAPKCLRDLSFKCADAQNLQIPDISYIAGYAPTVQPLVYAVGKRPAFQLKEGYQPSKGQQTLVGGYKNEPHQNQAPQLNCWILLEDTHGNLYVQQPRPTITHARRWLATNINLGPNIKSIILMGAGPYDHRTLVNKVLTNDWGSIVPAAFPRDSIELDRIEFPPTK